MNIQGLIESASRAPRKYLFTILPGAASLIMFAVGGNPDYAFPVTPELLVTGILLITASFAVRRSLTFSLAEKAILAFSILLLVYNGGRAILALEHTPGQKWVPCFSLSGWFSHVQCFAQAAVNQHYGFRTLYLLIVAWMSGLIGFTFGRSLDDAERQWYLRGVFTGSFVILLVGSISFATGLRHWLPAELPGNQWGRARFTQLIVNPSWVWPYLIPCFAFLLGPLAVRPGSIPFRRLILPGFLAAAVFFTQQRGGWLAVGLICVFAVLIRALPRLTRRGRLLVLAGIGSALLLLATALWIMSRHWVSIVHAASNWGISLRPDLLNVEGGRSVIWMKALRAISERPWTGHGYASWFAVMSDGGKGAADPFVYDTAHNFFLQAAVEHGLPMAGVITLFLLLVVRTAWRANTGRPAMRSVIVLLTTGTVVAMLVQEIDYVRPTILLHALVWGYLLGMPSIPGAGTIQEDHALSPEALRRRWLLRSAGILVVLFSIIGFVSFPRNLFPFEARLDVPGDLRRWAGPFPVIPSMQTESAYENFRTEFPVDGTATVRGITTKSGAQSTVWIPARSGRLPVRNPVSFSPRFFSEGRTLSAWILLPPVRSDLGWYLTENFVPTNGFLSCTRAICRSVLESCGNAERTRIRIVHGTGRTIRYRPVRPGATSAWQTAETGSVPFLLDVPFSPVEVQIEPASGIVRVEPACDPP